MVEKARRRPARSAAQNRLKQLETRLAHLETQLKSLRTQTSGSVGATRAKLETLERRVAEQIARAQTTLKESLDSITRTLAASKGTVEHRASRLTRAVRAGVRAGTRAYRRRARG